MPLLVNILATLEKLAPARLAYSFDNVGLQIGDPQQEITRAMVSLDRSLSALEAARKAGCQLLLSHHPLFFDPIKSLTPSGYDGKCAHFASTHRIAVVTAHTNLDCAQGGINDALAEALGLQTVKSFGSGAEIQTFKLIYTIGSRYIEATLDAAAEAGAGLVGGNQRVAFYYSGTATSEPTRVQGEKPGYVGGRDSGEEYRIETSVPGPKISEVIRAIREAQPYDNLSYELIPQLPQVEQRIGRYGRLKTPMSLVTFNHFVCRHLGFSAATYGAPDKELSTIAVVGGSGSSEWKAAQEAGADLLVTGEVRHHHGLEAMESGFAITQAGHFATEQPGVIRLGNVLRVQEPLVDWHIYSPQPGQAGKPISEKEEW